MHLAKVIGRVVATIKDPALEGVKLLLVQPVDHDKKPKGKAIIATAENQAGEGDIVAYVTGREATLALDNSFTPVDAGIVAIIDSINVEER